VLARWFLARLIYSSILKMEATFPPKCRLIFNGLHGVISQKIELFFFFPSSFFCNRRCRHRQKERITNKKEQGLNKQVPAFSAI
jgi:hypothetical protein